MVVHSFLCQAHSFQDSFIQTTFPTFREYVFHDLYHLVHCLFQSTPFFEIINHLVLFCCQLVGLVLYQLEEHGFCSVLQFSQTRVVMCIATNLQDCQP
jgi:hypothetical protein